LYIGGDWCPLLPSHRCHPSPSPVDQLSHVCVCITFATSRVALRPLARIICNVDHAAIDTRCAEKNCTRRTFSFESQCSDIRANVLTLLVWRKAGHPACETISFSITGDICNSKKSIPLYLTPRRGFLSEFCNGDGTGKSRMTSVENVNKVRQCVFSF